MSRAWIRNALTASVLAVLLATPLVFFAHAKPTQSSASPTAALPPPPGNGGAQSSSFPVLGLATTEGWTTLAAPLVPKEGAAGAWQSGQFYYTHGAPNNLQVYNPKTDTWAVKAPPLVGMMEVSAVGVKATRTTGPAIIVFGDVTCGAPCGTGTQIYNIATNTWGFGAANPNPDGGTGAIVDKAGLVHVFGGKGCTGSGCAGAATTHNIYNPLTDTWAAGPAMPVARGDIYQVARDVECTLPTGVIGPVPVAGWTIDTLCERFGIDDACLIYVAGGHNAAGIGLTSVSTFDSCTSTWGSIAPMSASHHDGVAGFCGGNLFVIAGDGLTALNEKFNVKAGTWSTTTPLPAPRDEPAASAVSAMVNGAPAIFVVSGHSSPSSFMMRCPVIPSPLPSDAPLPTVDLTPPPPALAV